MDNVPVRVNGPASTHRSTAGNHDAQNHGGKRVGKAKQFILASALTVVVAALVVCGLLFYKSGPGAAIDGSKYQAVFFTNGQVYFGKLKVMNGSYMKLTDVYYLQATKASDKNPQQTSQDGVELVKLGSEVHGPEDEMLISKEQVLFFENLKKDGKVSASIAQYQKKQ
jgi:hypothetical protein